MDACPIYTRSKAIQSPCRIGSQARTARPAPCESPARVEKTRRSTLHGRTVVITDVDTNRSLKTGITTRRISGVPKGTMRLWCMGLPRLVSAYEHVVQAFVDEDLNT